MRAAAPTNTDNQGRRTRSLRAKGLLFIAVPVLAVVFASAGSALYVAHDNRRDRQAVEESLRSQDAVHGLLDSLNKAQAEVLDWRLTASPDARPELDQELVVVPQALRRFAHDSSHGAALGTVQLSVGRVLAGLSVLSAPQSSAAGLTAAENQIALDLEGEMDGLRAELGRLADTRALTLTQELAANQRGSDSVLGLGMALIAVLGLGGVTVGLFFFTGGIIRRVRVLNRNAQALVVGGDLETVPFRGDELDELADEVTSASDLLRAREGALGKSEERLVEAQQVANVGSWEWDVRRGTTVWSDQLYRQLGWEPGQVEPGYDTMLRCLHPDDLPRVKQIVDRFTGDGGDIGYETRMVTVQGEVRWFALRVGSVLDENGDPVRLHGTVQDITERKAVEEQLAHNSLHDSLTGLPNRSLLLDRLEQAVAAQSRQGGSVAVLGVDLDRFKIVNDSLGHAAGDELLVEVGKRLVGAIREGDTVARFGGDEFVLLCEQEAREEAVTVAARVLSALARPMRVCGRDLQLAASIGIAYSDGSDAPDELVRNADLAMYKAKAQGGSRVAVFDQAMNELAVSRLELEADLRRAIDEREFRVFYQPVIALNSGAAVGVEALVRWEHPDRGLIPPVDFIPLAEETGL
ncbi:MAG: response regulator receiver modulated diguanylate cyclase/phosphodiesterase with sensor(s), partial [Acidimicrobiales bacterium]|nr:response regulator receiver modulated diguanylate cyclase/phosphodiesterase with sensor(s) [Acidimicrobiales bacterium]